MGERERERHTELSQMAFYPPNRRTKKNNHREKMRNQERKNEERRTTKKQRKIIINFHHLDLAATASVQQQSHRIKVPQRCGVTERIPSTDKLEMTFFLINAEIQATD